MNKPLSILSPAELSRLKFIKGTYLLVRGIGKIQTVHQLELDAYNKLETFLNGKAPLSVLKEGMKVFIIPDGSIRGTEITNTCRKLNLKVTTDVSKADVIIGNDNLKTRTIKHNDDMLIVKMTTVDTIYKVSATGSVHTAVLKYLKGTIALTDDEIPVINDGDEVLFSRYTIDEHYPVGIDYYHSFTILLVSDTLMNIVYHALSKQIPVVNDSELFASLEKVVINEEIEQSLDSMYRSTDSRDVTTANEILLNCDYAKSKFYIWKLWDSHENAIKKYRKTKMFDNFYNSCFDYIGTSVHSFIKVAAKENILPESFYNDYIKKEMKAVSDFVKKTHSSVSIDVKPMHTYEEFLKIHQNARTEETVC